ncbi:MAG: antibiotic biosynthesis monooxygenase [Candidatus Saccharibacteria bacterium]|nr:antibiotic biosynthesis monooxygenase [Candidatus Saccharibacteria bacterium]
MGNFVSIITLETPTDDMTELLKLVQETQHIFDKQPGFKGRRLLKSTTQHKLVQVVEWASAEDSAACMMSPDWQAQEGVAFMQFVQAGKASMQPEDFVEQTN